MSDLKLLSPHDPSPLERLLVQTASKEAPSAEQRQRVREALGLPALVVAAPPSRFKRVGARALGAVAGAIVVSALVLQYRSHRESPVEQAPPPAVARIAPPPVARIAPPVVAVEPRTAPSSAFASSPGPMAPIADVSADSAAAGHAPRTRSKASSAAPSLESGADLSEQLRLIEAARSAVAAHNPSAANRALTSYSQQFPRGAFSQEAAVLRIEALDLQGNHAQAASLAKRFLERHPNSPHVSLVQRIAASSR